MTAADSALAASALSTRQNAVAAQYGAALPAAGGVLGIQDQGGSPGTPGSTPASGVAGETTSGANPAASTAGATTAGTQAARQVSGTTASGLPFTGYAAIPLMLLGLLALVAGVALRRGTKRSAAGA